MSRGLTRKDADKKSISGISSASFRVNPRPLALDDGVHAVQKIIRHRAAEEERLEGRAGGDKGAPWASKPGRTESVGAAASSYFPSSIVS
jgi:hypothetical protein